MPAPIGAPGSELTRRDFIAATGTAGAVGLAGCMGAPRADGEAAAAAQAQTETSGSDVPTTSPPEVVDVHEQDNQVTLRTVPVRHEMDITNLAPAERHTIEFEADADPGIYLLHCHKVNHAMNGSTYPGGMVGGIVYEEAMDSAIFADLMDKAGYVG